MENYVDKYVRKVENIGNSMLLSIYADDKFSTAHFWIRLKIESFYLIIYVFEK